MTFEAHFFNSFYLVYFLSILSIGRGSTITSLSLTSSSELLAISVAALTVGEV